MSDHVQKLTIMTYIRKIWHLCGLPFSEMMYNIINCRINYIDTKNKKTASYIIDFPTKIVYNGVG